MRAGIALQDVSAGYGGQEVLCCLNGEFAQGSLTAVVGPNGGGKSTLLKLLRGEKRPAQGTIVWTTLSPKGMAYLPQQSTLNRQFPLTVFDVVAQGLWPVTGIFKPFTKQAKDNVLAALKTVGLLGFEGRLLDELSGGQFQRVLFARLLLLDASVILLDEPFSGVDHHTRQDLLELITRWHQEGKTVIVVLHDLEVVEAFFPETLILSKTVVGWGPTKEVLTDISIKEAFHLSWCGHSHGEARR